jgi:diguanylate cyclase (GGDEF)-like protein/PAS domain S-box-containing protein
MKMMPLLSVFLSEIISGASYILAALAIGRLFRRPMGKSIGNVKWLFVAFLAALACLQLVASAGLVSGCLAVYEITSLTAAVLGVVGAVLLWPFLGLIGRRLSRRMASNLQRRQGRARVHAAQSIHGFELGEALSHVGHWAIEMPDYRMCWSAEIYRIIGMAPETVKPDITFAFNAFHPDDRSKILSQIARAIVKTSRFEFEARLTRPDGHVRTVFSRGVVALDEGGKPTRLFGVLMDVTEQKQIEVKLREANMATESLNQALRKMALVDSLTNLPNRRHFDAAADTEFRRAIRQGSCLGIIMVDLDYFKGYNDLYGHPAGDACLHEVAQALAGVPRRPGDFAARYGGEEFVILLPNTDAAGTDIIAHAIWQAVAGLGLRHEANPAGYATVSCGAALFEPHRHPHSRQALMQRADRALYEAKRTGRNRVVIDFSLPPDEEMPPLSSAAGG